VNSLIFSLFFFKLTPDVKKQKEYRSRRILMEHAASLPPVVKHAILLITVQSWFFAKI
jgi:hypothetical protein